MEDEKYLDHEVRISKLEDNDKAQDKRIEIHGQQIDEQKELSQSQNLNIEIIKKDLSNIDRTTKKTEDKLDKLYSKPNENREKIINIAVGAAIGIIVTAFIKFLFPQI